MDQGIIWSLKSHYKTISIKKLVEAIEKKKTFPEFSILDDMQMLDVAWGKVSTKTVVNCFEKAEILNEKQFEALLDADDPFKHLQEQLDMLAVYNPNFFPEGTTANDIVSVDDSLTSTEPLMTDDVSYATYWMKKVLRTKMAQIMFLMNQFAHNLVKCIKLWMYFKNTCYLVIMESLFTNV